MKASYIKKKFFETIDSIVADPTPFVKRPGTDFTRNRLCPLRDLVTFLLTMEAGTLNREIRRFFFRPTSSKKQPITKAAIIQQRDKLNDKFFPFIFSAVNKIKPFKKTLKGYHLLACDGSDLNIPAYDDKKTYVASNTEGVGYYQFHLNSILDVLEQRYVDVNIQPRSKINERSALIDFIKRTDFPEKSIFIADRGYFSLNFLAHISVSKYHYVLRMNSDEASMAFIRRFTLPESDEFDIILDFDITRSWKNCYTTRPDKYVCLKHGRQFDFIPPEDKKSMFHVKTRLVKIKLSEGNYEFLFTDLPQEEFGSEELKHVYHLRWEIETSFSFLKYNMALNSFHSKRRDFICQEIYARMILFNLTMLLVHSVELPKKDCLLEYKVSISDAVITCRDFLHNRMSSDTVELLLIGNVTPIREGRTYPRKKHTKRVVPLSYRA